MLQRLNELWKAADLLLNRLDGNLIGWDLRNSLPWVPEPRKCGGTKIK